MGAEVVHGAKLLACSLELCSITPSAFSIAMSCHGLVESSFQRCAARHMSLHIYDTLSSVQLSKAILAGFAFSCTSIHLSCHVQGCNDTRAQFRAATQMDHAQLSHHFRLWKTTQKYQYFLRLQQHNA